MILSPQPREVTFLSGNLALQGFIHKPDEKANKPYKLSIFPAFGTTHAEGHSFSVRGAKIWGEEVFSFLASATS